VTASKLARLGLSQPLVPLTCYTASSERRMDLFAITISITDGKGHVVLADQAHDEALSSRVELRFPLGTKPEADFATREEEIIRDGRAVLAAALVALDRG
jgi:hypothetical protein